MRVVALIVAGLALIAVVFWRVTEDSALLYRGGFLALSALVAGAEPDVDPEAQGDQDR